VTIALLDDQALSTVLRGSTPRSLRRFDLATTGCWYVRLCQAVLGTDDLDGVLSGPFARVPEGLRDRALAALLELPSDINLISLRHLGSEIGRLRRAHALNLLAIEALAAAIHLNAVVVLSVPSPRLQAALEAEECRCRVLP
jgi:hypothetical protein